METKLLDMKDYSEYEQLGLSYLSRISAIYAASTLVSINAIRDIDILVSDLMTTIWSLVPLTIVIARKDTDGEKLELHHKLHEQLNTQIDSVRKMFVSLAEVSRIDKDKVN